MASDEVRIDLGVVSKCLEKSLRGDSVELASYLEAYRGLYRFFRGLGKLFEFVASDIISKINILEKYLNSKQKDHYSTVEAMVKYEAAGGISSGKEPSGSRTLLRLHRALEFIVGLLEKFQVLGDKESTGPSAKSVYKETLGKFHPWLIQKGALLAIHYLPNLEGLVEQTTIHSVGEFRTIIPETVRHGKRIYQITQDIYKKYDCLNLP